MKRKGSVLMEFLLVAPIILLLVSMILQFAQIWVARQITAYAAYCATRASLTAPPDGEEVWAARAAARSVCSWMCLVGLSTDPKATLVEETVETNWGRYHKLTDEVEKNDTFYRDVSKSRPGIEYRVPGWGTIPGSSSRGIRVKIDKMKHGGNDGDFAAFRVNFKFPLVFPLAGRIISWAVAHPKEGPSTYDRKTGTWKGGSYYSIHSGWQEGRETVMNDDGSSLDRSYATYGQDGKYPFIELSEMCVLPRPYTTKNFRRRYLELKNDPEDG